MLLQAVIVCYTNHRGETAVRRILPQSFYFGSSQWHPKAQWLLDAYDTEKEAMRTFALKDIHHWRPEKETT